MAAREVHDVVVVGSGPNGLAAAVTCARSGLDVVLFEAEPTLGGGARTLERGLAEGLIHDVCSAVHPMAVASPFFRGLDLEARGVELHTPEVSYAQAMDGGEAAVAYRSLDRTVAELGAEGPMWRRLMEPLVADWPALTALGLGHRRSIPAEVASLSGVRAALAFGAGILANGTSLGSRVFPGEKALAMLAGVAAHAISQVPSPAAAGTAVLLGGLGHAVGWPLPVGGSQAITDALVADLTTHGGQVRTEAPVTSWKQLPRARAYFFDTTPRTLVQVWGERMKPSVRAGLERFPHGNAGAKVDFVLSEPVPWANSDVGKAGTVHLGGTQADVTRAEAAVAAGRHAEWPTVLVSDPAMLDPGREVGGLRPLWTYAHVPAGSTRDVTEDVTAHIERYAPGFRDVVVASRCTPAARMSEENANYVGGDIAAGLVSMYRMFARPRPAWNPYDGGIPGVYLCSASTPPGPGVHGMGGYYAAGRALRSRFGITTMPDLGPNCCADHVSG